MRFKDIPSTRLRIKLVLTKDVRTQHCSTAVRRPGFHTHIHVRPHFLVVIDVFRKRGGRGVRFRTVDDRSTCEFLLAHHTVSVSSVKSQRNARTSPEVTPPSNSSLLKPNLGSLFIVKASLFEVLLKITKRLPLLRSSSRHSTAPGKASAPSSGATCHRRENAPGC